MAKRITRRGAVLAALFGAIPDTQPKEKMIWLYVEIPDRGPERSIIVPCKEPAGPGVVCADRLQNVFEWAIVVRWRNRVVRLTAEQVMDALEAVDQGAELEEGAPRG